MGNKIKRAIYTNKTIGILEQGSIINGCVAREYKNDCIVHGIIITPRCDLTNAKVNSVHYLPVVKLSDWIYKDFWSLFSKRLKKDLLAKLSNYLSKYNLSNHILTGFTDDVLLTKIKEIFSARDYTEFEKIFQKIKYTNLPSAQINRNEIDKLVKDNNRLSISIFKELKENKLKEYYLLENWESQSEYHVVLMREIERLDYSLALEISKGAFFSDLSDIQKMHNNLVGPPEDFLFSAAILNSPFIEHLIQHFFLNFGRIGIQDHPYDLENMLFSTSFKN